MKSQRPWKSFQEASIEFFHRVGFEGLFVFILGCIGIIVGTYDFLSDEELSPSILVAILSLFLIEIVLQRARFEKSKEEIISSLKGVQVQRFVDDKEFAIAKYQTLLTTTNFVYDTELCKPKLSSSSSTHKVSEDPYRELLHKRIIEGKITCKYVEVIYSRPQFESILRKVFMFYQYNYYIGYFVGAPEVVPTLNIMIFDDKHFFVGGYYGSAARGESRPLHIQHEEIGQAIRQYFDYLWVKAGIFNERSEINWDEVKHCALQLGYSTPELNETVAKIAEQVGLKDVMAFK